jgi:hypothetical protein
MGAQYLHARRERKLIGLDGLDEQIEISSPRADQLRLGIHFFSQLAGAWLDVANAQQVRPDFLNFAGTARRRLRRYAHRRRWRFDRPPG